MASTGRSLCARSSWAPVKWQYLNNSGQVVNSYATPTPTITIYPYSCTTAEEGTTIVDLTSSGTSGYQYDSLTNTWQYNWKTTGLTAGCYNIRITNSQSNQIDGPYPIQLVR